jgi:prevent-host-death family protein
MSETVTAADANRQFSQILRKVREGASYVVTSHGKAVARIVPVSEEDREKVRAALIARLKSQPAQNVGPWTRDELYER